MNYLNFQRLNFAISLLWLIIILVTSLLLLSIGPVASVAGLLLCLILVFLLKMPELAIALQLNGVALYLYAMSKFNLEPNTSITGGFYGLLAGSYLIGGWLANRKSNKYTLITIDKLFLLLYVMFYLSYLIWSQDNLAAYNKVIYALALVIAPYFGVFLLTSKETIKHLIDYIGLISIIMIIPSFYELINNPVYEDYGRFSIYRFEDKGDNPIQFGISYALLLIITIFKISEKRKFKYLSALIIVPSIYLMIRSGARGPVISFTVTMLIYFMWLGNLSRRLKKYILIGLGVLIIGSFSLIPSATINFYHALLEPDVSPTQDITANSIEERIYLMNLAVQEFISHPLLGVGTGNSSGGVGYPHNSIIEVAAELGIIGLSIFMLLHALVIKSAYHTIRRSKDGQVVWLMSASFAIYIFAIIESLFSGYMGGDMLLYSSVSLVSAIYKIDKQSDSDHRG